MRLGTDWLWKLVEQSPSSQNAWGSLNSSSLGSPQEIHLGTKEHFKFNGCWVSSERFCGVLVENILKCYRIKLKYITLVSGKYFGSIFGEPFWCNLLHFHWVVKTVYKTNSQIPRLVFSPPVQAVLTLHSPMLTETPADRDCFALHEEFMESEGCPFIQIVYEMSCLKGAFVSCLQAVGPASESQYCSSKVPFWGTTQHWATLLIQSDECI